MASILCYKDDFQKLLGNFKKKAGQSLQKHLKKNRAPWTQWQTTKIRFVEITTILKSKSNITPYREMDIILNKEQ